jgi:hypothetical protein
MLFYLFCRLPRKVRFFTMILIFLMSVLQNYSCNNQIPRELLVSPLHMSQRESSGLGYEGRQVVA